MWWMPHLVLGVLLVVGMAGFLGFFNKALGFMAAPAPEHGDAGAPHGETTEKAVAATPTSTSRPARSAKPPRDPRRKPPQAQMFGARHLLVAYKGSKRASKEITRTKEEAQKRAEEASKKAKVKGAKFEDLVKEYTDEPGGGQRGGDLGKFRKGQMVGPFQDAVEKLKVGEASGVVETDFGYHVILRTF